MISNSKGASVLIFVLILGVIALLFQSNLASDFLNMQKDWKDSSTFANKNYLLNSLAEDLENGIPLQFSRYSLNSILQQCLTYQTVCDETQFYEMALFAPILQQSYQGGAWPQAPNGALLLAGGRANNVTLYRASGERCPVIQTQANSLCPLQAIIEFKPLCGGTPDIPNFSVVPGPCAGPANGVEVTIGVARYLNGALVYKRKTEPGGDAKVYRFPAMVFRN